jgi:predicted ATPase
VPYILKQATDNDREIIDLIIKDMNVIGYPLENVFAREQPIQPNLQNIFTVAVKETNLKCETEQSTISNGMFRALCLIVLVEYLIKIKKNSTIIIDDLGEGLDFDRSTKLTKLLFEKTKESDLQLIITSNDRFLINNVEMQNINYLERNGHIVKAINYHNNKDVFDKFLLSGLNNFDFINPGLSHLKN